MCLRLHRDQGGAALITVIGLTFVLSLLAVVALTYVRNAVPQTRQHGDWHAALAAADAGIDDYLARINRDLRYYEVDADSQDPTAPDYNAGLDPDAWAQLLGSDAEYTYEVDASEVAANTVRVTSTGRVGDQTRTIEATLRPRTFIDFIYLTNEEPNAAFATPDDIFGPLHSNDTLKIIGSPRFHDRVTVANDNTWTIPGWWSHGASPEWLGGEPEVVTTIPLPPRNAALSDRATTSAGGCLYYGPTYIQLVGDQMRVNSPLSEAGENDTANSCLGVSSSELINLPESGVIYVADFEGSLPGTAHPLGLSGTVDRDGASVNPTRTGQWTADGHRRAGDVFIWGELDARLTVGAQRDIVILWDLEYTDPDGSLLGLIANDHISVWNRTNGSADLAITSTSQVIAPFPDLVHMPPLRTGDASGRFTDPVIDAAMLALRGSFRTFNLQSGGNLGIINVNGSVSQQRRRAVGTVANVDSGGNFTISQGYGKNYRYDNRLQYMSPPFFINPVESQYRIIVYAEVDAPEGLPE